MVMTVREAFVSAYGPIPEGATCHVGQWDLDGGFNLWPTYKSGTQVFDKSDGRWTNAWNEARGPDISDRPASAFLGFFGPEYDAVVEGEG